MSIIQGSSVSASSTESGGFYDFPIEQTLRFDGSSYLSKQWNQAYTSQTITYSLWVKFSDLSTTNTVLWAGTLPDDSANDDAFDFYLNSARIYTNSGNGSIGSSTALFRDTSSWYHFVMTADSTNGFRVYVNGGTSPINTVSGFTNHNFNNNSSYAHIGAQGISTSFKGYLAEINFIDGQALSASSFGETKNGVWIPKAYTGSYGTNGFHLQFNPADFNTSGGNQTVTYNGNSSTLPNNHVADVSGSGNHWELL